MRARSLASEGPAGACRRPGEGTPRQRRGAGQAGCLALVRVLRVQGRPGRLEGKQGSGPGGVLWGSFTAGEPPGH